MGEMIPVVRKTEGETKCWFVLPGLELSAEGWEVVAWCVYERLVMLGNGKRETGNGV